MGGGDSEPAPCQQKSNVPLYYSYIIKDKSVTFGASQTLGSGPQSKLPGSLAQGVIYTLTHLALKPPVTKNSLEIL